MDPDRLGRELRESDDRHLERRRRVALLTLGASASMAVVSLYQLGLVKHLPEPPIPGLDADRVDASEEAYELLDTPDGVLGLGSYAATLALASMGGARRWRGRPWLPLALTAKATVDAVQAARLTRDQWTRHGAFYSWCLGAAAGTFMVPLTLPEARDAPRALRERIPGT